MVLIIFFFFCLVWTGNQNLNQRKSSRTTDKASTCVNSGFFTVRSISRSINLLTKTFPLPTPFFSFVPPAIYQDSFCGLSKSREDVHASLSCLLSHWIYYTGFQAEYFVLETEMKYLFCERSDELKQNHSSKGSCSFWAGFSPVDGDKELIILYGPHESGD